MVGGTDDLGEDEAEVRLPVALTLAVRGDNVVVDVVGTAATYSESLDGQFVNGIEDFTHRQALLVKDACA